MINVQFDLLALESDVLPDRVRARAEQALAQYEAGELDCDFDYIWLEMSRDEIEDAIRSGKSMMTEDVIGVEDRNSHVLHATLYALQSALDSAD